MVVEEKLLRAADREARRARVSRSSLLRTALQEYLARGRLAELARRDRDGYARKPLGDDEFAVWDKVRSWPDE